MPSNHQPTNQDLILTRWAASRSLTTSPYLTPNFRDHKSQRACLCLYWIQDLTTHHTHTHTTHHLKHARPAWLNPNNNPHLDTARPIGYLNAIPPHPPHSKIPKSNPRSQPHPLALLTLLTSPLPTPTTTLLPHLTSTLTRDIRRALSRHPDPQQNPLFTRDRNTPRLALIITPSDPTQPTQPTLIIEIWNLLNLTLPTHPYQPQQDPNAIIFSSFNEPLPPQPNPEVR